MANRIVVEVPREAKAKGKSGAEAAQAVRTLVNQAFASDVVRRAESRLPGLKDAQVDVQEGTEPKSIKINVPRDTALKGMDKKEIEQLVEQLARDAGGPEAVQGVDRVVIDSPHGQRRGQSQEGQEREASAALIEDTEPEEDALGCYCRWRRACFAAEV